MNRLVAREEVKNLLDVTTNYIKTPELLNQPGFEAGPVVDVVERPTLIQWDGLKRWNKFGRVVTPGQGESIHDRGQPGVEVIGLATLVVSDEFGWLETGRGWLGVLSVEQTIGRRSGQWSGGDSVGVEDL